MFEIIKKLVKRIPGIYDIDCFLKNPAQEINNWREFFNLKRRFGKIDNDKKPETKGKLLIISLQGNFVTAAKIEMLLAKAAQFKGLEPVVLTNRWAWANRFYRAFGIKSFIYFDDFRSKAKAKIDFDSLKKETEKIKTFYELMDYQYNGVNTGKYICSSLVRKTYSGVVDMDNLETQRLLDAYFKETSINTIAAVDIYDLYKPDTVLFLERGYTPYGEFFDIALKRNLNIIQWCGSHKNNALTVKRYNSANQDQHPASLSQKTWEILKNAPWDKNKEEKIKNELFKNYSTGEWFSEVGTQFKAKLTEADEIRRRLGLDPAKKTAVILPHLFWDATFFWGEDIFTNYREWFVEAVKAACKNTHVNWILKFHPANVVKLNRDGYKGELIEKISIKESIGELPPHIKTLEPNTNISTYSLYQVMDYCLTVRGTPGIEAAMFGVAVLTAGTGRYDRHGFTIDSDSREEYLKRLSEIHTYSRLTDSQIELALKFAYGTFLARPFELKSLNISYKKDKKATQVVNYTAKTLDDLKQMDDIKSFGKWLVESKNEDYLDSSKF